MLNNQSRSKRKLSVKESKTQIIEISRGKNGYGFTLSGQSPSFVSYVVRGSPADAIGLLVGDYVISVNGQDVSKSDHEDVVRMIGISVGTLFLGVSQALDVAKSESLSPTKYNPPPSLSIGLSKVNQALSFTQSFSRTDKVLKDLHSGEIFKNMASSPTTSQKEIQNMSDESIFSTKPGQQVSGSVIPSMIMVQSVVAYLGTVEMPMMEGHTVAQASLDAVRGCVQRLRVEQHIHQRVLFKVTQTGIKMYNADGDMIALYRISKLHFSAACPDDGRFFCLVTNHDSIQENIKTWIKTSCHIFMVDPEISLHDSHKDKAKRFGIQCSTNTETGDCVEFPKTPRSILAVVRLLQTNLNDQQYAVNKTRSEGRETSLICNSTADSGIVDTSQDFSTPHYHILDYHPHSRLTRGESSLPAVTLAWTNNDKRKISVERKQSSSSTDDSCSHLSPRALFTSSDGEYSKQAPKYGSSKSSYPTLQTSNIPPGKALSHHKLHSGSTSSGRPNQQVQSTTLSQHNLHRHDNHMKHQSNSNSINQSHIPPPMHKLSMGKYRIPELRGYSDLNRHGKRTERGKPPCLIPGHQVSKRDGHSFTSRFVALGKAISRSTENVAVSDEDGMSGASSVESLASNASLPSCINGSLGGNFDYGYHRSSLRASTISQELNTGRISHWAVSFDRLLDDPLGVKYFKDFLCKEFSEENILFWEACEELRRIPPDDTEALQHNIKAIHNRFLAHNAAMPVNIDSQGQQLAEEALTATPHPNIFINQQNQVYTLMKLDSYSRFLKSSLYRHCMVCEMEGRSLPLEGADPVTSDSASIDSSSYSRPPARGSDAGISSFRRKGKKSKGSKKSLFGFKNRPKGGSFQRDKSSTGHDSSRDSSGSESYFSSGQSPLVRSGSLPTAVPDFPDSSRVCHVTLWDNTTTVIYAKKSGMTTVAEALDNLCQRRGVKLSAIEAFMIDEGDASQSNAGVAGLNSGKQRHSLSLDLDVSVLASRSIVLERRALFRLDMLPVRRSVGVRARPTKTIADALESVVSKYNLLLADVVARISDQDEELFLNQPVSNIDGLRIILEQRPNETEKKEIVNSKEKKEKLPERKVTFKSSVKSSRSAEKQEQEELLNLMSLLQNSKMHDQRGLISKQDLELPDFLKLHPDASRESHNANNSNNNRTHDHSPLVHVVDASSLNGTTGNEASPYAVTSVLDPDSVRRTNDTSGKNSMRRTDARRGSRGYVELNTQPKNMTTFKPPLPTRQLSKGRLTPEVVDSDPNDTTIVEDPDIVGTFSGDGSSFDLDSTLMSLPTPPLDRTMQNHNLMEMSMANFSPPTPLSVKTSRASNGSNDSTEGSEDTKTIMV